MNTHLKAGMKLRDSGLILTRPDPTDKTGNRWFASRDGKQDKETLLCFDSVDKHLSEMFA